MTDKKFNLTEIEKIIASFITKNFIDEEDIIDTSILLSLMLYGEEKTRENFDCIKFVDNLRNNGAMSDKGEFFISNEDEEFFDIWFLMTLMVGKGLFIRK